MGEKNKKRGWKVRGWRVPFSGTPIKVWHTPYGGPQADAMSPREFAERSLVTYYTSSIDDKVVSRTAHIARASDSFDYVISELADHLSRALRPAS